MIRQKSKRALRNYLLPAVSSETRLDHPTKPPAIFIKQPYEPKWDSACPSCHFRSCAPPPTQVHINKTLSCTKPHIISYIPHSSSVPVGPLFHHFAVPTLVTIVVLKSVATAPCCTLRTYSTAPTQSAQCTSGSSSRSARLLQSRVPGKELIALVSGATPHLASGTEKKKKKGSTWHPAHKPGPPDSNRRRRRDPQTHSPPPTRPRDKSTVWNISQLFTDTQSLPFLLFAARC